MLFEGDVGP